MFRNLFCKEKEYKCILTKKVHCPHHRSDNAFVAALQGIKGCDFQFTKIIILPFVPQIGMTIQEYTEIPALLPKDKSYIDGVNFKEKIEALTWRDGVFDCETKDHNVGDKDDLGIEVLKLMKEGWTIWGSNLSDEATDAVEDFFKRWEDEIERLEQSSETPLEVDRDELHKIREIWNFQRLSLNNCRWLR